MKGSPVLRFEPRGHDAPVAQVAVEWASASTESQQAGRLSIVRGFLTMVRAAEPDVDVPAAGLVRTCKRPTPRILAPDGIVHGGICVATEVGVRWLFW